MKTVLGIFLLILLYFAIGSIVTGGICCDKKLYKFSEPKWDDSMFPPLNTSNDKFVFFTYLLFWPIIVCFRYIPKLLYIIGKFLLEYLGWIIAKLFKL